jgi:curved DNA-binding protein CbpA
MSKSLEISWAAGKFVYPKHGSSVLHFMPLPDFLLDSALDISLLLLMRFLRRSYDATSENISLGFNDNSSEKSFYEILNVPENASQEVIQKSYWELSKKLHPDISEESAASTSNELLIVQNAYQTLSDDNKRRHYDLTLRLNVNDVFSRSSKLSQNRLNESEGLVQYQQELQSKEHPFSNSYEQLVEWQRSIYLDQIGEFVIHLISVLCQAENIKNIIDVFPGIGLLFETIKFEILSAKDRRANSSQLRFIVSTDSKQREVFRSLHKFDDIECHLFDSLDSVGESCRESLLILNCYQAIRDGLELDYKSLLGHQNGNNCQSIALILLVSSSNEDTNLYNVNRNRIFIPSKSSVERHLISTRRTWFKRYLSFDKSYLLCSDSDFSGEFYLMLAYTSFSKVLGLHDFSVTT